MTAEYRVVVVDSDGTALDSFDVEIEPGATPIETARAVVLDAAESIRHGL